MLEVSSNLVFVFIKPLCWGPWHTFLGGMGRWFFICRDCFFTVETVPPTNGHQEFLHQAWMLPFQPHCEARGLPRFQAWPRRLRGGPGLSSSCRRLTAGHYLLVPLGSRAHPAHNTGLCISEFPRGHTEKVSPSAHTEKYSLDPPLKLAWGRLGICHRTKKMTLPDSPVSKVKKRFGWCPRTDCLPNSLQRWLRRAGRVHAGTLGTAPGSEYRWPVP